MKTTKKNNKIKKIKNPKKRKVTKKIVAKDKMANYKKKAEIEKILADFNERISFLEKKRTEAVAHFLKVLDEEHIKHLKNNLKF